MQPIKQPENLKCNLAVYIYNPKPIKLPSSMREYCRVSDKAHESAFFYVKAHLSHYTLRPCAVIDSRKKGLIKSYIRHKTYDVRQKSIRE